MQKNKVWLQIMIVFVWGLVVFMSKHGLTHYEYDERNAKILKFIIIDTALYTIVFFASKSFYHRFISSAVIWNEHFSITMFSIIMLAPILFIGKYGATHVFYEGLFSITNLYMVDTLLSLVFPKAYAKSME